MTWLKKMSRMEYLRKVVQAAGMSRILQHSQEGQFAQMSAERSEFSPEENAQRTEDLKAAVIQAGYGFIDGVGAYTYEGGSVTAKESSLFIPGINKEEAQALAAQFGQESFIWGEKGERWLIYTSSGNAESLGTFNFLGVRDEATEAPFYTEMKGRRWKWSSKSSPHINEEIMASGDVRSGLKIITTPEEHFKYGGFITKNRGFALVTAFDLSREGQPYFFLWGGNALQASPRFGIAVHDLGDLRKLRYNAAGHFMPLRLLDAYIPLERVN